MTNVLVVGADAAIGAALLKRLATEGMNATGTSRRKESAHLHLDLSAPPTRWPALPACDSAIICAAVSKLDACESDPDRARKVNIEGTLALAQKLHAQGTFILFLSSNHVFDGTRPQRDASDPASPLNEYGRQKAETEHDILALGNSAVLRLTKVVIPGDARIGAWKTKLEQLEFVTAFDDIFLAPSTLANVEDAIVSLITRKASGIHQLSGEDDFSYFDLALEVASHLKADTALVKRGSGGKAGVPTSFRPRYSSYKPGDFLDIDVPDAAGIVAYALEAD